MWGGLAVGMVFYVLFGIAPAAANVLVSFTNYSGLPGSPTSFAGLSNYTALWTTEGPGFVSSITETIIFVVGVTVVQNVVAMLMAHRLQGKTKTSTILRVLAFFPIVLGVTVIGIVFLLLFDPLSSPAQACLRAIRHTVGVFRFQRRRDALGHHGPGLAEPGLHDDRVHRRLVDDSPLDLRSGSARRRHAMETLHHHNLAA